MICPTNCLDLGLSHRGGFAGNLLPAAYSPWIPARASLGRNDGLMSHVIPAKERHPADSKPGRESRPSLRGTELLAAKSGFSQHRLQNCGYLFRSYAVSFQIQVNFVGRVFLRINPVRRVHVSNLRIL